MKKAISLILCLLMFVSCMSFSAAAEAEEGVVISIRADRQYVAPGDTAVFSVYISGTYMGYRIFVPIANESGNLEVVDIVAAEEYIDVYSPEDIVNSDDHWSVGMMPVLDPVYLPEMKMVDITVRVRESAEDGVETIGFDPNVVEVAGSDGKPVSSLEWAPGSITVQKGYVQYTPAESFEFELNGNEATITAYNGEDTEVRIAPTYVIEGMTYTVTAITGYTTGSGKSKRVYSAFAENTDIVSVSIPDTVEMIGDLDMEYYSFYGCTSLIEYTIYGNPVIAEATLGMYYDEGLDADAAVAGAMICAWSGDDVITSNAQAYAIASGIAFEGLESFSYKGCQVSSDIKTAETFNIRFAGIIDSLNYQTVGYEISVADPVKYWESESRNVYRSLLGTTADGTPITAVTAAELGGEYIMAATIKGAPGQTEITFEVIPYVVNVLGARVYGEAWNVNVDAKGVVTNERQ